MSADALVSAIPGTSSPMVAVAAEVLRERVRQDEIWGEQNHPNGTGLHQQQASADRARMTCELNFRRGAGTWADILREEFAEALAEGDPIKLRAELVQVAAVAQAWVQKIDREIESFRPERGDA